jgi:hypothetical protein
MLTSHFIPIILVKAVRMNSYSGLLISLRIGQPQ